MSDYIDWVKLMVQLKQSESNVSPVNNAVLKKIFALSQPAKEEEIFALNTILEQEHGINFLLDILCMDPIQQLPLSLILEDYSEIQDPKTQLDNKYKSLHWGKALLGVRPLIIVEKFSLPSTLGLSTMMQEKVVPHDGVDYFSCYQSFKPEVIQDGKTVVPTTIYFVPTFMIHLDVPLNMELSQ